MTRATVGGDIAEFRHQVEELVDRNEIADLTSRLGLWLDEKRFDDARSIFTDDATGEFPSGPVQGVQRLADQARRNHSAFDRTQHLTTNLLIDLHGDRATVRANQIATFVDRGDTPEPLFTIGERYRFEAVRTPRGWRFSRVEVSPVWRSSGR